MEARNEQALYTIIRWLRLIQHSEIASHSRQKEAPHIDTRYSPILPAESPSTQIRERPSKGGQEKEIDCLLLYTLTPGVRSRDRTSPLGSSGLETRLGHLDLLLGLDTQLGYSTRLRIEWIFGNGCLATRLDYSAWLITPLLISLATRLWARYSIA